MDSAATDHRGELHLIRMKYTALKSQNMDLKHKIEHLKAEQKISRKRSDLAEAAAEEWKQVISDTVTDETGVRFPDYPFET